jgi:chromosome segregation protein
VLADFLEVEPRYERVVEDFLRDELNFVVVKSWDAADEGLRLLRSDVNGRATFLVHPEDSQAKFSFVADESHHYAPLNDTVLPLKNSIRVLNGFGKSLEVILPKLGNGYIVPDPAVARELALSSPDAFFLSQTGECFHNVTVTGGKQRSEGPLSMKRELRDVLRLLEELERALREKEMLALTLGREIKEHTALLDRLEEEKREAEKQAMTSGHLLKQLDSEMSRVRERIRICEREMQRLAAERQEQESLIESRQAELATIEEARAQFEMQLTAGQERLTALRGQRDIAAETTSQRAARVATLEERHRSATTLLQRIETLVAEMRERALCKSKWNRRAPKSRNGKTRTCNWPNNFFSSKPSATLEKRAKACCSSSLSKCGCASQKLKSFCATRVSSSIWLATAGVSSRPRLPSCNPTCNTSPTPA